MCVTVNGERLKIGWLPLWIYLFQSIISSAVPLCDQYHHFSFASCTKAFLAMFYIITWGTFFRGSVCLQPWLASKASFKKKAQEKCPENPQTTFKLISLEVWWGCESVHSLMAGVDLTDSSSAAGADDFDPIARKPHESTGYRCHGNSHRCTTGRQGKGEREMWQVTTSLGMILHT